MKQEFKTYEELELFMESLLVEEKFLFDVQQLENNAGYAVQWQVRKEYVAVDGKSYKEEAWLTDDGQMIQIQDLEVEHCRNIIRMILRNERTSQKTMEDLAEQIIQNLQPNEVDDDFAEYDAKTGLHISPTLH